MCMDWLSIVVVDFLFNMSGWLQTRIPQMLFQTVLRGIFPWLQVHLPVVKKTVYFYVNILFTFISVSKYFSKEWILPHNANLCVKK